jgi:hypothetical protein
MDKETLSNYGWIVILVLILAVMIALATPFGSFIADAVKATTAGFFSVNQNAMGAAGITIPGQEFADTNVENVELVGEAYAIYTDSDKTLRFIRSEEEPVAGDEYNGITITKVYSGIETAEYEWHCTDDGTFGSVPWVNDYARNIKHVIFVDTVKPIKTDGWFAEFYYCETFDIAKLDTSDVTSMYCMFIYAGAYANNFYLNVAHFDTSKVQDNMGFMFGYAGQNATTFELVGLENFDTSNINSMYNMFQSAGASAQTFKLNLTGWDMSNIHNAHTMFSGAGYNSQTFEIIGLDYWDVSSLESADDMFNSAGYNATNWSIGNLSNWELSSIKYMAEMFRNAGKNANYVLDLSAWKDEVYDVTGEYGNKNFAYGVEDKIITPWE